MACIIQDPISKNVTVRDSVLYEHLKQAVPEGYEPDMFALAFYDKGEIKSFSKEDVALALWSKINGLVADKVIDTDDMRLDENGEPVLPAVREWLGLPELSKDYLLSGPRGADLFIKGLQERGLIEKMGETYRVVDQAMQTDENGAGINTVSAIAQTLKWLGIPQDFISMTEKDGITSIDFNQDNFYVSNRLQPGEQLSNTRSLIHYLADKFPQLTFQFVGEKEARKKFEALPELSGRPDFDQVNSFVAQGVVYLIENRVNDLVAIEEVLHPFIDAVAQTNKELFTSLRDSAVKDFPGLRAEIAEKYASKDGFSEADRDLELVTQALSKVFHDEVGQHEARNVRGVLPQLLQWFQKLIHEIANFLGGVKQVFIRAQDLRANMKLSDVARLLNSFDSRFLIDPGLGGARFSLSSAKEATLRSLKNKANELQEKVLEDLCTPKQPVVFMQQQQAYLTMEGAQYASLTTAINGKNNDAEDRKGLKTVFGKNAARVLEALAVGRKFDNVKDLIEGVDMERANDAYTKIRNQLYGLKQDGSIVLPNVVVADHANDVAATLDLVLLHADGRLQVVNLKFSDESILDEAYMERKTDVGNGSRLQGDQLSDFLRNGIKVAGMRRLLEHNDYPVDAVFTFHILTQEHGIKIEDKQKHSDSENDAHANKIFPNKVFGKRNRIEDFKRSLNQGNLVQDDDFLDEDEQHPEEPLGEPIDQMTVEEEPANAIAGDLAKTIDRLMQEVKMRPKSPEVQKLSALLTFVKHDLSQGKADLAYGTFLRKTQEELDRIIKYLAGGRKDNDAYVKVAIEASWYIKSFEGIGNAFNLAIGNDSHARKLNTVVKQLRTLEHRTELSMEDYILHMVRTISKKDLQSEDWEELIKEAIDISKIDYLFGDIDTSTDTLIAVAAKTYKKQRLRAMERIRTFNLELEGKEKKFAEASGGDPDFLPFHETDEKGKLTGWLVHKIGHQFHQLEESFERKLRTAQGVAKQFRMVTSLQGAKQEDLEYNKGLYKDKEALRKFREAEAHKEDGYEDGKYFKYDQDLKDEREKYEVYEPMYDDSDKFIGGKWVKKEGISDAVYYQYKRKFYNEVVYDKAVFDDQGEFTGTFVKDGGKSWFVKTDFVSVREVAGDGTDMTSKKWRALQEDTSALGEARRQFYKYYTDKMEETLDMLPENVQQNMYGKLPRVRAKFMETAKKSPSFFKAVAKSIGNWFSVKTYAKAAVYNDDGTIASQIPLFFTGNLRNEEAMEQTKNELKQLDEDYKNNKLSREKYLETREAKREELHYLEQSVSADELNINLVENLSTFRSMAENYYHLNAIEGAMNAVLKILGSRKYGKKDSQGRPLIDPKTGEPHELKAGTESWAYKRFKKWMQMTFYNSEEFDRNTMDMVLKKVMSASSVVNVGFNTFGAIHNYIMARINTVIESAGGVFYTMKAAKAAMNAFNTEFIPGYLASLGKKEARYSKHAGSKYEALVNLFFIYRKQQSGENRITLPHILSPGFFLMEIGEYSAQTKSGIAYLMSQQITNSDGSTSSIYDAYDFKDGSPTLKPGFDLPEDARHEITNAIWEMNKQIHGNYTFEDRMVIQQEALGQVAAQYHKWIYPMYKARFKGRYFDENLGWLEGRYLTVYEFFKNAYQEQGGILKKLKGAKDKLDPLQVKNMYRNAAELGFFMMCFAAYGLFRALASGADNDDKNLKRWLNFLSSESDRDFKEILFWIPGIGFKEQNRLIKNPFAVGPTLEKFAGIVGEGLKVAMPPYEGDSIYYTKGPFQGEMKLWKEVGDVLPIWKDINKWRSFSQVTNFYIK